MPAPYNPHRDGAREGGIVRIGGRLIIAHLKKINGLVIEDEYNVQRPVGQSGAVAVFKGTKIAEEIKLTFTDGDGDGYTSENRFDDLWDLWELLRPAAGVGGAAPPKTQYTIGETKTQAESSGSSGTPGGGFGTIPAGSGTPTGQDGWPKNAGAASPGPKPPTLTIDNPWLAWIGVFAISRKKWEGPYWDEGAGYWYVDLTVIQAKKPTPANVGAQSKPNGAQFTMGQTKNQDGAAAAKAEGMASPV